MKIRLNDNRTLTKVWKILIQIMDNKLQLFLPIRQNTLTKRKCVIETTPFLYQLVRI